MNGELQIIPAPMEDPDPPKRWPMKKILLLVITASVILAGTGVWLFAAPTIGTVAANPPYVVINTPTQVLFTVDIPDPSVLPTGVNLLQVDGNGKTIRIVGAMRDDGTSGDATAGDKVFSRAIVLNEATTNEVRFQVSAAFRGVLRRVLSNVIAAAVVPTDPDATIVSLAAELEAGDIADALTYFAPSRLTEDTLTSLTPHELTQLAVEFRESRLLRSEVNLRVYTSPTSLPDGSVIDTDFTMARTSDGRWLIISW